MSIADPEKKCCTKCGEPRLRAEFSPRKNSRDGLYSHCKICRRASWNATAAIRNLTRRSVYNSTPELREQFRAASKRYREKNRETLARRQKETRKQLKQAVFKIYGGCCSCCGERAFEFLSIDHMLGGGTKERKIISIPQLYRKLFEAGVRQEQYRVLCYNCNLARGFYGYCPHSINPERMGA